VYTLTFFLHCVFILVLVGLNNTNVVFTFVGLLLTEVLPSLFLLSLYRKGNSSKRNSDSPPKTSGKDSSVAAKESSAVETGKS
jgi:hypothetical protein